MKTKPKGKSAAGGITQTELAAKRRAASMKGLAARWGESRQPSRQIRVDESAYNALQRIPERDRREVASRALFDAATTYAQTAAAMKRTADELSEVRPATT